MSFITLETQAWLARLFLFPNWDFNKAGDPFRKAGTALAARKGPTRGTTGPSIRQRAELAPNILLGFLFEFGEIPRQVVQIFLEELLHLLKLPGVFGILRQINLLSGILFQVI